MLTAGRPSFLLMYLAALQLLAKLGADINKPRNLTGLTPLMVSAEQVGTPVY